GFLTPHLSDLFRAVLPDWAIVDVPLSLWLSGLAFGVALAAASAWLVRSQARVLLFVPFVLVGWFAAVQICVSMGVDEPKNFARALIDGDTSGICNRLDGAEPSDAQRASQPECDQLFPTHAQLFPVPTEEPGARQSRMWQSLGAYVIAGAVGALITAFGIPFATGGRLSRPTLIAIALAGAAVAAAWFLLTSNISVLQADEHWYALFVPWQAAVAALIGRATSA